MSKVFSLFSSISNLSISLEQFDKTKTKLPIPLKQEELFLEVFEDEVNEVDENSSIEDSEELEKILTHRMTTTTCFIVQ